MLLKIYYRTDLIKVGKREILGMYGIDDIGPDDNVIANGTPAFSHSGPLKYPIYDATGEEPIVREAKDELEAIQYGYLGIPEDKYITKDGVLALKDSVPVDKNIVVKTWNDAESCWVESDPEIVKNAIVVELVDLTKELLSIERLFQELGEVGDVLYTYSTEKENRKSFLMNKLRELRVKK